MHAKMIWTHYRFNDISEDISFQNACQRVCWMYFTQIPDTIISNWQYCFRWLWVVCASKFYICSRLGGRCDEEATTSSFNQRGGVFFLCIQFILFLFFVSAFLSNHHSLILGNDDNDNTTNDVLCRIRFSALFLPHIHPFRIFLFFFALNYMFFVFILYAAF